MKEVFEHGGGAGETFAGALCGGWIGCIEKAFIRGADGGGGCAWVYEKILVLYVGSENCQRD
jgi:hypothetical protein